ncbi:prepilin-type N-terminal cleavage/methylation domain-containing protein [sulfur-oxidizing endosymbiont of Gigantopelta aegis]|uniref:prepilin-type N-terminal cleavage/methylation domain-containing protein n=1 Tax=sulfur-oxidizing endosymbiont of Gigantopelta aegis TaxID=2794934 RepID=UPI0018DCACFE|nr:prepilin-type N-terminal cleavage/methylation domain-containing protein [sulfur-oxidizing endosymbiont of Gigantopelta aegis]
MIKNTQAGVTLIELVISIVIISIAIAGVTALFIGTSTTSADPMVRAQQLAIAKSYIDEIMMQPYENLVDGATTGRANYNEVDDYNAIIAGTAIADQYGNSISALSGYSVEVVVSLCTVSSCGNELDAVSAKKIIVSISHAGLNTTIPLTAYRTDY